jgi:hypothetical protein
MIKHYAILSLNKVIDKIDVDNVDEDLNRIDRFSELFASEFFCKDITENKKIKMDSLWDGTSFSEFDEERKEVSPYSIAFVSNNIVKSVIRVYTLKRHGLYKEAEINGISAVEVSESDIDQVKTGMSWDGTSFTE